MKEKSPSPSPSKRLRRGETPDTNEEKARKDRAV